MSFSLHYTQPLIVWALMALLFLFFSLVPLISAAQTLVRRSSGYEDNYQPSWFMFLAFSFTVALVLALIAGQWNYQEYMQKYYNLGHLHHYEDVDTNSYVGQQVMDAGRIDFKGGTVVDAGRSMGFKEHDMYCVAPIITRAAAGASSGSKQPVDFWAVGKGCCSGYKADFHCGGFNDPLASGAIRLMNDADRPFYRLAVQQAEATYGFTSPHPLFFQWVHNGDEAVNAYAQHGRLHYFCGICAYFALQLFLVSCTTVAFSTIKDPAPI